MNPESLERNYFSKEKIWNEKLRALDRVVDRLGQPIDQGIRDTVAVLNCLGFETEASCEGHVNAKFKAPWIDISFIPGERRKQIREALRKSSDEERTHLEEALREAKREMLAGAAHLLSLLDEFYVQRSIPFARRLIVRFFPDSVRLQSQGGEIQDFYEPDIQK